MPNRADLPQKWTRVAARAALWFRHLAAVIATSSGVSVNYSTDTAGIVITERCLRMLTAT